MNLALTWPQAGAGRGGRSSRHDQGLHRVATRLAVQTAALVLALLVVLEGVVYVITQQAQLGALEATLQSRAVQANGDICHAFRLTCAQPGTPGHGGGPGQPQGPGGRDAPPGPSGPGAFAAISGPSDASAVFVDPQLHVVHADGVLGSLLLGPADVRQAVQSDRVQCCIVHAYDGQDYLVYTAPIHVNGKIVGTVQTSISERQYQQTMDLLLRVLLVVALLGLLGAGGVSAVLVQRALRPIRVAMQRQRDFVADAAHELRTPLAIQRTVAEVAMADPSSDDLQATVEQMLGENQHLTKLVEDLSLLARADTDAVTIDRRPVDLSRLVTDTADEIRYLAGDKGITLDARVRENVTVLGDILRLRQLLLILLDNALKHTPSGGKVRVRLSAEGGRTRLVVADSGQGIHPADLSRIFDRFYRADQARTGEGAGLGLAIAQWIVEAHGGQIQAGNTLPRGAMFTVTLPVGRSTPAA